MTGDFRLRPMRWWHIDQIMPLEQELFAPWDWSAHTYWSELAAPGRWYVVALDQADQVVGYLGLATNRGDGDIQTVGVSKAAQGQGLGRTLLQAAVDEARDRDVRRILLEVRADNAPAIHLYRTVGFEQIAQRRRYYQPGDIDALIMSLEVPERPHDQPKEARHGC